ncbi:unnamed protein product [Rhodiola kirilowii]
MVVDGKEKAVTDNEMSHSDEHNQNLSSPPSKTRNLRIRKLKEGDASSIPPDASDSKQKKKKKTDGCSQGVREDLIALPIPTSRAHIGLRQLPSSPKSLNQCSVQPPTPISALEVPDATTDINQGDKLKLASYVHPSGSNSATEMLGNVSSLQPEKQCTAAPVVTVNVEAYRLKPEFSATAQYILKRYGDIVACTSLKGPMLAHLLQSVCVIYQKLEMYEFIDLTLAELEDMSIEVSDFLKINMNVGWLNKRLDDIINAKKLHQSSTLIKDTKRQTQQVIVELENELRIKEEAMQELQVKVEEIKEKLFREKTTLETLNQTIMEGKEKVKRFQKKSLVDDI